MTTVSEVKKSDKILKFYGNEHQLIKAVEEMGELQMAIAKYLNGEKHNIEEEIADVTVMMLQLTIGLDTEKIDQMVMTKLDRQLDRILDEEIDQVVAEELEKTDIDEFLEALREEAEKEEVNKEDSLDRLKSATRKSSPIDSEDNPEDESETKTESHGQWYSLDKDGIPKSRELTEDEWNAIVDKLKFEAEANGIEITETEDEDEQR